MQCFRATLGRKAVLLLAPVLLAVAVQGYEDTYTMALRAGRSLLDTNVTTATVAISVPSACSAGTITSSLDYSCAVACSTSGSLDYTFTQRSTLDVSWVSASSSGSVISTGGSNTAGSLDYTITQRTTLEVSLVSASAGGSLIIIGGSNTAKLQEEDVTDLTLQTTTPSTSLSWINQSYTGFSYTPKLAKYPACGSSGTQCTFAFYVVDAATLTGSKGKACRFSMEVVIDPMTLPAINASQLYNVNAAPVAVAKAPLALLALLAVPMLLVLAL